ncbi:hypothetical protein BC834DRAFT_967501 [Gloeopeniophorella convolvens]|nr:hypothetical protein BC834DRAFT_967501 [Gloeopeniophorella convolvens]
MARTLFVWPIVIYDVCETFFFGIYTVLFTFSMAFLFLKRGRTWTRDLVLAASVVMYTVSATHWAINTALLVRAARNSSATGTVMSPAEELAITYVPSINYVLSDAIVVWRAWVLWGRRYDLFIPPILFLLGTIATSVVSAAIASKSVISDTLQAEFNIIVGLDYSAGGLIILTNLWATGLIFIRAWQHRLFLRSLMGKSTPRTRAEKAVAFLIESGAIYLCIWITFVVVNLTSQRETFIKAVMVQVIGIYPTIIVVVVTMRLSTADVLSQSSRSEQLAPPTPIVFVSRSLQSVSFDDSPSDTPDIASSHGSIPSRMHAPIFIAK